MLRLKDSCLSLVLALLCLALATACTYGAITLTSIPAQPTGTVTPTPTAWVHLPLILKGYAPSVTPAPSPPDEIRGLELAGYLGSDQAGAVFVRGNYAYVGFGIELAVVDISDPDRPQRVGCVVLPNWVLDVATAGSYAYIATGSGGLHVVDVSDPTRPAVLDTYYASSHVDGVVADGSYAYVSNGALRIMDLSDPAAPVEIGAYSPPEPAVANPVGKVAAVMDDHAHTTFYSNYIKVGGLRIMDVSDPTAPAEVSTFVVGVPVRDAAVTGDYAYLLVGQGVPRLVVVDIADPEHPAEVNLDPATPWLGQSLAVVDRYLYLAYPDGADSIGSLQVLDVADPARPVALGCYEGLTPPVAGMAVEGGRAYIATGDGLVIVDISDPAVPVGAAIYRPDRMPRTGRSIAVAGDYAYVAAGWDGLQVVDVSDPISPDIVSSLDTAGHAWDVALADGHVYLADEYNGLRVIDVTDPSHPVEVGFYDIPGPSEFFCGVAILDDPSSGPGRVYAYVADALPGNTSLRVIDISDPTSPREASLLPLAVGEEGDVRAYGVAAADGYVYVAVGAAGLRIVDVSDPAAPREIGLYDAPGRADNLVVAGDYVYLVDGDLRIVDVSDPTSPTLVGFYDVPNLVAWPYVAVQGRYAYLTAQGIRVLDVSDPGAPVEVAALTIASGNVTVADGMVYVIGNGLFILRPLGPASADAPPTVTPQPKCETYTATMALSATATTLKAGDIFTVTVTLANQGCGMLGLPQYRLYIGSDETQPIFDPNVPEPVVHYLGVASGQSDAAEFALRAVRPGEAMLSASASFEFHAGYPGPAYWGSSNVGPLFVTVAPIEQVPSPDGDRWCLVLPKASIEVCFPRDYSISTNTEANRRGSFVSYGLRLGEYQTPCLSELQFFSEESIYEFTKDCDESTPCFFGDYPDLDRYYGQRDALMRLESYQDFELHRFNDRYFLVANRPCYGDTCVTREYTTFLGDVKLDVWITMHDESQIEQSDRLFTQLIIHGFDVTE